jgi:hypothetical protein
MADQDEIKKKLIETSQIVENTLKSVAAQIGDIFQDALSEADGITKIFGKDVEKQLKSLARSTDKMVENQIKIKAGQASSKDISKQILDYQIKREVLEKRILNLTGEQNDLKEQLKRQLADVDAANQDYIEGLKEQESQLKKIEARMGVMGKLAKGLNKIPLIGNLIDAKEVEEKMKIAANNGKSPFIAGFKEAGKTMTKSLVDPLTIFTFLATQINKADKQATLLGRSFGISKQQARGIREEFVKYSADTNDTFINTDRLLKAQTELSEQLGIAVQFSGEELTTFSKLTEIVGLSAQEAGKLATFSAATGISSKDYVKQIRLSSFATQQANKVHFSDKQILQDISKLSAGILVKFQNNPKALAAAVIQAKALGLTLEQVDKVGESLLNFESSIENELKAELLTGKQINLEKARYAALTGDQLTLAKEVADQAGSLAEFEEMNVLAQKSLAEAFGMSRDELADMLLKQEAITTYGDKAAKLNAQQLKDQKASGLSLDDYLEKQDNQRSIQEKFNDAILKLQDLIGNLVAGPLGGFIDSLSNGLGYVTKIFGFFGKIGSAIKGFFGDKIGGVLGDVASVATIGALIALVARSMTKGTTFNPMITKEVGTTGGGDMFGGGSSGGLGRIGKAFSKGGMKGGGKAMGRILSKTLKGNALTALLMGGIDAASNLSEGQGAGESFGRAGITSISSLIGGGLGSLIAPGAGTIGGGILGGIAGDKIGDLFFGEQAPQQVEDGISPSSKGPFTVTDKFGATAITAKGDSLAVSPNVNNASLDLTPMINAINEVRTAITALANRPINTNLNIDGRAIGTAIGKQMETGTSQVMNTGYQMA